MIRDPIKSIVATIMQLVDNCILLAYNSNDGEKDDHSKGKEGDEGIGLDVRVSVLIHLHQNYTSSDEHKGSICIISIRMKFGYNIDCGTG